MGAGVSAVGSQIQQWIGNKNAPGFGDAYADFKALEDARLGLGREKAGMLGTVAEAVGGMATAAAGKALQFGQVVAKGIPSLMKAAAPGAGLAAAYGFGSAEGGLAERGASAATGAALGLGAGTIAPTVATGLQNLASATMRTIGRAPVVGRFAGLVSKQAGYQRALDQAMKNAPGADEIAKQSGQLFEAISNSDVVLSPEAIRGFTARVGKMMESGRMKPRFDKGAQDILDELTEIAQGPAHIAELHIIRQQARALMSEPNGRDAHFLKQVIDEIDKLAAGLSPADLVSGKGAEAGKQLLEAMDLWSRSKRTSDIEQAIYAASLGRDFAGGLRSQFKSILLDQEKRAGFAPDIIEGMERIVRGGPIDEGLRAIASARGIMGGVAGGVAGGPIAAVGLPMAGMAAKSFQNAGAKSSAGSLRARVATGALPTSPQTSPVVAALLNRTAPQATAPSLSPSREAIVRALSGGGW